MPPVLSSVNLGLLRRHWALVVASIPASLVAASWWCTTPLELAPPAGRPLVAATRPVHLAAERAGAVAPPGAGALDDLSPKDRWPADRLEGEPAKRFILRVLEAARARLDRIGSYTATFFKQERIGGKLGPRHEIQLKVRQRPFAVYMRFLHPDEGKEVIYADGRYENHLVGHFGGLARRLVPRLKVKPTERVAMLDNRHPITEAGLSNLVDKLIHYRRLDLVDADVTTTLDRTTDDRGRPWFRARHSHSHFKPERPFPAIEVLFDPETLLPRSLTAYDWPESGRMDEPLPLGEIYSYEDLVLDPPLSDLDFDPANPKYEFTRF